MRLSRIAVEIVASPTHWLDQIDVGKAYSEHDEEIKRRLNWEYPFQKASEIPVKFSVTELKKKFATEFSEENAAFSFNMPTLIKKPAFMEERKGLNAAEIGSILHFVMQHLDFNRASSIEDISFQVGEMVFNELLTEQQAKTVDVKKIFGFLNSALGRRLLSSNKFYREVPFNIEVCSKEFYKDLDEEYNDETILMQGVIDCYFEEQDEIVLLDYKTDYVPDGRSESLRDKYKLQIDYYTMALEQLTGKTVKGKYIYSFWNGEVLEY